MQGQSDFKGIDAGFRRSRCVGGKDEEVQRIGKFSDQAQLMADLIAIVGHGTAPYAHRGKPLSVNGAGLREKLGAGSWRAENMARHWRCMRVPFPM